MLKFDKEERPYNRLRAMLPALGAITVAKTHVASSEPKLAGWRSSE